MSVVAEMTSANDVIEPISSEADRQMSVSSVHDDDVIKSPCSVRRTAVKVFVCSTGQDMQREQNALIGRVYGQLRDYTRHKYGLEFHAFDLQGPISNQLVSDYDSLTRICNEAIDECRAESVGPTFLALVGQRYGDCPLPNYIRVADYDVIRAAVMRRGGRDAKASVPLLDVCYERDYNELDPGRYRLISHHHVSPLITHSPHTDHVNRFMKDDEAYSWEETVKELKRLIWLGIGICLQEGQMSAEEAARYIQSAFDSQLRRGLQLPPSSPSSASSSSRCLVLRRTIADLKNHVDVPLVGQRFAEVAPCPEDPARLHLDPESERSLTAVVDLISKGTSSCCVEDSFISRSVLWRHSDGISERLHADYLDDVCRTIHAKMIAMIDSAAATASRSVDQEADRNNVDDDEEEDEVYGLDLEIDQHWTAAREAVAGFQGQEEAFELVHAYVISNDLKPLVVFGEIGAGKTTVVSKAALEASSWIENGTLINIVRFVHNTSMSRDIRRVLSTVCAQLCAALQRAGHLPLTSDPVATCSVDGFYALGYARLVECFHRLLDSFPDQLNLVICVDGLDLLSADGESACVDWIPRCVKEQVKLVVTARRGSDLLLALKRDVVSEQNNFVEVPRLSAPECTTLLVNELSTRYHRCLADDQLCRVAQRCLVEGAVPLYVKLLATIVRDWPSSQTDIEHLVDGLPLSTDAALDRVLERVEGLFGKPLVTRVLGLLSASELGLSDTEMDDVLSLDDAAFDALPGRGGSQLSVRRMPSLVWYAIKRQLTVDGWLTTRHCHRVLVNTWRCGHLASRVALRYASDRESSRQFHAILADYLLGRWAGIAKSISSPGNHGNAGCGSTSMTGEGSDRIVPRQPLIFDCSTAYGQPRYNLRKFNRLPVHLQRAGRQNELNSEVLFNFDWIFHKATAFGYESVIDDYRLSADLDARLVEAALCLSRPFVGPCRQNIGVELTGRLLPHIGVHQNVRRLVSDCDRRGLQLTAVVPNFPYRHSPGGPLRHTVDLPATSSARRPAVAVRHHQRSAMQFVLVDGKLLLGKDPTRPEVHVIDPTTGDRKSDDIVTSVGEMYVSASGRFAAIVDYDREKSVKIHRLDGVDDDSGLDGPTETDHERSCRLLNSAANARQNGCVATENGRNGITVATSSTCDVETTAALTNAGRFVGHIVPSRYIALSSRDKHRLTQCVLVGDSHVVLGVESATDSRCWIVVGDLVSCAVVHVAEHRGRVTCCRSWRPEVAATRGGIVYVGVDAMLYVYQLEPTVRLVGETKLPDIIRLIAFTKTGRRGFVAGDRTDCLSSLSVEVSSASDSPTFQPRSSTEGRVELQTRLDLKDALTPPPPTPADGPPFGPEKDSIRAVEVSESDELVLIRGRLVVVVYSLVQDRVTKVIRRPNDVPKEFRLPHSDGSFTPLHFTMAHFTGDSKYVVASIFRDIYIWPLDSGTNPMSSCFASASGGNGDSPAATIRCPIGIVFDVFVASTGNGIVSVGGGVTDSTRLDVWDLGVVMAAGSQPVGSRDRLTAPIRDVRPTEDDSHVFVSTTGSDEIGVYDMRTGQLVDLMTHEGVVTEYSVTADGRYMLVSLEHARPGQVNKIWNTECRRIVHEFGDVGVHSVPLASNDGFFVVGQSANVSVSDPYHVIQYRLTDNDKVTEWQLDFDLPHVLAAPFLTPCDRYLIVLHAADYNQPAAHYVNPQICAVALRSKSAASSKTSTSSSKSSLSAAGCGVSRTTYSPADLRCRLPAIKRFLEVRRCPTNSYNVVVLYTNESDRVETRDCRAGSGTGLRTVGKLDTAPTEQEGRDFRRHRREEERRGCGDGAPATLPARGGYEHNFGFLILDVCSAVVCQIIEDCFPPYTQFSRLLSTFNHRLYVDQNSNIYNMATGYCASENVLQSDCIELQQFALADQVLIGTDRNGYLHAVRLADGQLIASVCVHGEVTALRVLNDSRTIVVGFSDGAVLSYVLIDLETDADGTETILTSLGTRQTGAGGGCSGVAAGQSPTRVWDKVDRVAGTAPSYSRPPSAIVPLGPTDKLALRRLQPDSTLSAHQKRSATESRTASSSQLYRISSCRSAACRVM